MRRRLLADAGYKVAVIALRNPGQAARETWNGIEVYRVPTLELFKKTAAGDGSRLNLLFVRLKSFLGYVVEYLYFTSACFLVSAYIFVTAWLRRNARPQSARYSLFGGGAFQATRKEICL